ncbi:MAG: hypothetical protein L6R19_28090 [Alphaproteobacteria bacterium]|nr:hypothetical protein [Alphaproteobacteria bacterium]
MRRRVGFRVGVLAAVLLGAAACGDSEPGYVLDKAKLRANADRYFTGRDKFIVAQVCSLRTTIFDDVTLFLSAGEIRWEIAEQRPPRGPRPKIVAHSPIVDGAFTIPEEISVVRISSSYRIVDSGGEKAVEMVAARSSSSTSCRYPLKRR